MTRALALLLVASLATPAAADGPVYSGVKQRRSAALGRHRRACAANDAAGCVALGRIYQDAFFATDGEQADGDRAFALYRKACDLGSVKGCVDFGWCYHEGMGVGRDWGRAEQLYRQGCDAGEASACALLGAIYRADYEGSRPNPRRDRARARGLFERVCGGDVAGLGCTSGCNDLAVDAYYGRPERGLARDLVEASRLYQRACEAGCSNSCDSGARQLRNGEGVPRDDARAARMYQRACDIGLTPSCAALGEMYRDGAGVRRDRARARALFAQACRRSRGQVSGCEGDPGGRPLLRTLGDAARRGH